jgi:hypothetical protein
MYARHPLLTKTHICVTYNRLAKEAIQDLRFKCLSDSLHHTRAKQKRYVQALASSLLRAEP